MIANFFSKTKPSNIISILFLLCIFYISSYYTLDFTHITVSQIAEEFAIFSCWLLLLFFVYFIIRKNSLTKDNSYAILLYVLLIGFFSFSIHELSEVLSNLLLLMALRRVFSLEKKNRVKSKIFDAGLWIGLAFIFSPWAIFFLILVYIGMSLYKRMSISNLLLPILGAGTPIFLFYTCCLLINEVAFFENFFNISWSFDSTRYQNLKLLIPITFLISIVFWSVISCSPKILSRANKLKYSWILLINHLIIAALIVIFSPNKDGSEFVYAFFPVAVIITNYLETVRDNWFKEVILWLFISTSFVVYFL